MGAQRYALAHRAVDLSAAEHELGIPAVPVWQEANLDDAVTAAMGGTTLASFHGPRCGCGRPFGITYDLDAMVRHGSPNNTLLHELVHAWQYHQDPEWSGYRQALDLERYGYFNAPHEVEARRLSRMMDEAGIRVWFPERVHS